MNKATKKVFISQYCGYGDWLSVSGMARFLAERYDYVYILADGGNYKFIVDLYKDNLKIKIIYSGQIQQNINDGDEVDILDLKTGDKQSLIPSENYFNLYRQLGPKLGIPQQKIDPSWFQLEGNPCQWKKGTKRILQDNASAFYVSAGLPKEYRLEYFHYERDLNSENNFFESLNLPDEYIVISEYGQNLLDRKYITNDGTFILNINEITQDYFNVIKIIENAKEVHLLENSTSLMTYYLQYKNLMKDVKIIFHTYGRREPARKCTSKKHSNIFLDMVMYPKLKNWTFIYL